MKCKKCGVELEFHGEDYDEQGDIIILNCTGCNTTEHVHEIYDSRRFLDWIGEVAK